MWEYIAVGLAGVLAGAGIYIWQMQKFWKVLRENYGMLDYLIVYDFNNFWLLERVVSDGTTIREVSTGKVFEWKGDAPLGDFIITATKQIDDKNMIRVGMLFGTIDEKNMTVIPVLKPSQVKRVVEDAKLSEELLRLLKDVTSKKIRAPSDIVQSYAELLRSLLEATSLQNVVKIAAILVAIDNRAWDIFVQVFNEARGLMRMGQLDADTLKRMIMSSAESEFEKKLARYIALELQELVASESESEGGE